MKLRNFSVLKSLLILVVCGLLFNFYVTIAEASDSSSLNLSFKGEAAAYAGLDSDEKRVFDLINRERAKKGLSDLEWNSDLAELARNYSQQMARENFFSHFDRNGGSVVERAGAMRIKDWRKIGENLFECENVRDYAPLSVREWMKSPGHRRNILDEEYNTSGIGIAATRDGKFYITQVFTKR